jgi:hypothetical protein
MTESNTNFNSSTNYKNNNLLNTTKSTLAYTNGPAKTLNTNFSDYEVSF